MRRAALLAPLLVFVLAGSSGAGNYNGPRGDTGPQWSPNGTQVVYTSGRPGVLTVGAAAASGSGDRLVPGIPVGLRSPDWTQVAFSKQFGTDWWTVVSKVDGTDEHRIVEGLGDVTWSPDSSRIAFSTGTGIAVSNPDGSDRREIISGAASGPAWSPDHRYIAYFEDGIRVVSLASTDDRQVSPLRVETPAQRPVWSGDGASLAYWANVDSNPAVAVSHLDGSTRTFPVKEGTGQPIVWVSNGSGALLAPNPQGYVRIDVSTGAQHQFLGAREPTFLRPSFSGAVFSPDGSELAYSSGGECRDRLGIYVANADGTDARRISNSCRIVGTNGPDVLHADWSRVVLGLGGDDMLYADDTGYYFQANTLYGGPGNDTLFGGHGDDTLYGGPGNDVIEAGLGSDVIVGGPGNDHIYADRGADVIYARDGQQDWIDCGKPGYAKRDVVYADKVDKVAANCRIVHRG